MLNWLCQREFSGTHTFSFQEIQVSFPSMQRAIIQNELYRLASTKGHFRCAQGIRRRQRPKRVHHKNTCHATIHRSGRGGFERGQGGMSLGRF
jgi:hypothetical protein